MKLKSVTAKNFLSIGNQTQAVNLDSDHLTLVLGENLDLGGGDNGSRNGVGKTAILNAISYALYGQALTNIKKENLINKINGKNMLVTVEFEKNNCHYRIERGRKPNILKFFANNQTVYDSKDEDESQGDSRETQKTITQLFEMSHTMFKHILALNTYTEPFLSMRAADQREVIEQLLGITILSEKAENLKVLIKETKDKIQQEQYRIEGVKTANENIQKSIDSLKLKSRVWEQNKEKEIEGVARAIMQLENVDIQSELDAHKFLQVWNDNITKQNNLTKQKSTLDTALSQAEKNVKKYTNEVETLKNHRCPNCDQDLHNEKHQEMVKTAKKNLKDSKDYMGKINQDLDKIKKELEDIGVLTNKPNTFYETAAEALSHKNNLTQLEQALTRKIEEQNPYDEQIEELKNSAIQPIEWTIMNTLTKHRDHQEFLLKLLTNKDSFIRKKIIDQNLTYLNKRLGHYIDRLGLPHRVVFQNDLSVEITQLGQSLDFDNLSRGERNRLILSMSFAFRDVWESLYQPINLLFIDELVDSGMDSSGVENALSILKKMSRERNKNIYLISHKDELIGRVNNVLRVVKESGFTSYSNNTDYVG